jgi:hypothetical protein
MLRETKDTVTIPVSFMIRMLTSIHNLGDAAETQDANVGRGGSNGMGSGSGNREDAGSPPSPAALVEILLPPARSSRGNGEEDP